MKKEIYFNNAATSWPKPERVLSAMTEFFKRGRASGKREGFLSETNVDKSVDDARRILSEKEITNL